MQLNENNRKGKGNGIKMKQFYYQIHDFICIERLKLFDEDEQYPKYCRRLSLINSV